MVEVGGIIAVAGIAVAVAGIAVAVAGGRWVGGSDVWVGLADGDWVPVGLARFVAVGGWFVVVGLIG